MFNNKIKIQIKSIYGSVLFEYSKEGNTIKNTLEEAIKSSANLSFADLSFANLRFANLISADLSSANLSFADLSFANLSSANLRSANLSFTNLSSTNLSSADLSFANLSSAKNVELTEWANQAKQNILFILSYLPSEIENLKTKINEGKIDGTQYTGDCCCLIGTLGETKTCNIIPYYSKGLHNLGEQFFFQIKKDDTPENNIFSKVAIELCDEALARVSKI